MAGHGRRTADRGPDLQILWRHPPDGLDGGHPIAAWRLPSGRFDRPKESSPMKAKVTVTLKSGILDPQGKAIEGALKSLGVDGIASVRQGKVFDIEIADGDPTAAEARLREAAEKLLANTVIENYDVKLIG
jgi:phosphoribosylformylglycinamidine synthase subunit PurS